MSPDDLPPPYPGLETYGDDDDAAELFFGRASECELVIANLRATRLTVLHGPSGAGKSSLLRAGVLHRLRQRSSDAPDEDGEPRTDVVFFDDWADDPAARLAAEIRAGTDGAEPVDRSDGLLDAVNARRLARRGGLLVILDQFEDVLRAHSGTGLERFVAEVARDPRLRVRLLIAVRDDRLADLDRFGAHIPGLLRNVLRLGPLSPAAALESIAGPIERYRGWVREGRGGREVTLEPGLASEVRDELVALGARRRARGDDPEGTELGIEASFLQLVMRRLWDEDVELAGDTTIRRATLARLGGAEAIVGGHLERAIERLPRAERAIADDMLRFLVRPSGAIASLTAHDLGAYTGRPEAATEAVAETLTRAPARVLRATAEGYELHEILAEPALWRARHRTARLEARARRLTIALLAVSAAAVAVAMYALHPAPLERLELAAVDARFDVRGGRKPDARIALVTLDDAAYARILRDPGGPRAPVARALRTIADARPRAVAVDIVFDGRRKPTADEQLMSTVRDPELRSRLVLATDHLDFEGKAQLFGRVDFDDTTRPAAGYAGFPVKYDDVARRIERHVALPPGTATLNTVAVATARLGAHLDPAKLPGESWIDYRGPRGTFPRIAFEDVARHEPAALARLRGRFVVLGVDAADAHDVHGTSAPGSGVMTGPEIQANMLATALDGFPLRDNAAVDFALIALLGLLPAAAAMRLRPRFLLPAAVAIAALFCIGAQLAFGAGTVVSVVYPLAALALATAVLSVAALIAAGGARRAGRSA